MIIYFKPLDENDFEKMYHWINLPHVNRWWDNRPVTYSELVNKYSKRIASDKYKVNLFGIRDEFIGFIQSYIVEDPKLFKTTEPGVGIDLFIGEKDFLHKGYGTEAIQTYIDEIIKKEYDVKYVFIDTDENNLAAIKSYMKVGFRVVNRAICPDCGTHTNVYMTLKL